MEVLVFVGTCTERMGKEVGRGEKVCVVVVVVVVCVCVLERERERERETTCVYVCVRARARTFVNICVWWVSACVTVCAHIYVCMYMFHACVRASLRECVRVWVCV